MKTVDKQLRLADLERYIKVNRAAPRNIRLAAGFISQACKNKKIMLYGAGSHTAGLLQEWDRQGNRPQILALIDRMALGSRFGYKVIKPRDIGTPGDLADLIVLSHHEYENSMLNRLGQTKWPEEAVLPIYTNPDFSDWALGELRAGILSGLPQPTPTAKPIVLVVRLSERIIVGDDHWAALKTTHDIYRCNLSRIDLPPHPAFFKEINLHQSIAAFLELLEKLKPQQVYVQDHYTQGNFLASFIKKKFPKINCIAEYYDFLIFTFNDPYITTRELYYTDNDVDIILWGENNLSSLDGVVTKEAGQPVAKHLADTNYLHYGNYLPTFLNCFIEKSSPGRRLVFAGSVNPSSHSALLYGENQILSTIKKIIASNYEFDLFLTTKSEENLRESYSDYLELAAISNEKFRIHLKRPVQELIHQIAPLDYGIVMGNLTDEIKQTSSIRLETSFPGKLYTYIAAGLPIIVCGLGAAGDFVEERGIGRRLRDIGDIDHISQAEYISFKTNLKKAQEEFVIEKQKKIFCKFIKEALPLGPGAVV